MTRFLAVTDLHYCGRDIEGAERRNILSAGKLREAVNGYAADCDFIAGFGDTADSLPGCGDQETFAREIYGILSGTGKPVYCLIGNHDTSLPKEKLTDIYSMPGRYYSFESGDYLFIALDTNMNSPDSPFPEAEIEWKETYLDYEQLAWLEKTLNETDKDVIIFSHALMMLEEYENDNPHVIRNRDDALAIIEKSGKVKAVICGHYHYGDLVKHGGVYYVALTALVNYESANFAVISVYKDRIEIEGHGLQKSMVLDLK
ncbi:MAG: metallophosphoesterase [Clostridia bacterium]|nr:metallophosphoesterase [Clostridia bacterium]